MDSMAGRIRQQLAEIPSLLRESLLEQLRASERHADPRALARYGYRSFSQNEEDGLLDEIFRRIGTTQRFFVEFGVQDGTQNNTLALLLSGWRGLWLEGDPQFRMKAADNFAEAIAKGQLRLKEAFITAENIEELLIAAEVPEELDVLSIDIDYNDYWVWKAITRFRPRVVVIEYNANLGRSARAVVPYDPAGSWDGRTVRYGASLGALEDLGREKGYLLVGCNLTGVNAFFVRGDCAGELFLPPYTAAQHYEPPRHGVSCSGHAPAWALFQTPGRRT
jgi:hypothetical protein